MTERQRKLLASYYPQEKIKDEEDLEESKADGEIQSDPKEIEKNDATVKPASRPAKRRKPKQK